MIQDIYNVNASVFATSAPLKGRTDSFSTAESRNSEIQDSKNAVKVSISMETRSAISQIYGENVPVRQIENFFPNDYNSHDRKNGKIFRRVRDLRLAYSKNNEKVRLKRFENVHQPSYFENDPREKMVNGKKLSEGEQEAVRKLEQRDREVKAHEQRHVAAAGPYARGGIVYEYQVGPDGKLYAVGGHVNIDTSPVPGDDEATIRKAQIIRAAALASADASTADRAVAAEAIRMEMEARQNIVTRERGKETERAGKGFMFNTFFLKKKKQIINEYGSSPSKQQPGSIVDLVIP